MTPILPIGLCLLVVMVATGLAIVHVLDGVREWDLDMMRRLVESRTTTLDRLTEWGTWFAETIPVVVITVVVVAFARWKTGRWSVPLAFAAAIGTEKLIYLLTSVIVQRDRPPVPTLGETYATASFPSGHVGSAIALYGGIALVAGVITGRRAVRLVPARRRDRGGGDRRVLPHVPGFPLPHRRDRRLPARCHLPGRSMDPDGRARLPGCLNGYVARHDHDSHRRR